MMKKKLLGMTLHELRELAQGLGMPAFTGGQIAKWIYTQHVRTIDEMTNLSKHNRELLSQQYEVGCAAPIDSQHSVDGTAKYLFPVETTGRLRKRRKRPRRSLSRPCSSLTVTAVRSACRARWAAR